jgi:2-polyprenyl-3-methyl-5-hydroxy-6-metoxy-1,4-benzoquinol methylase
LSYRTKFKNRSNESEILDRPYIPKKLLFQNLHELDFLNHISGGNAITMQGIKKLVTLKDKSYHIVDLGCGGGGTMRYIAAWARKKGFNVKLTGVDKNSYAIQYMRDSCNNYPEITGVVSDYRDFLNTVPYIDIVHCSLFCHHLNDQELANLISYLKNNVRCGFVINDLVRSWISYYVVKLITHLLNGSELSKNDGPISVLRGFRFEELDAMLQKAQIKKYTIKWKLGFRYLIIGYPDRVYDPVRV